jgi:hypothetical protein
MRMSNTIVQRLSATLRWMVSHVYQYNYSTGPYTYFYLCFVILANNRKKLAQTDSRLVQYLIALMDTKSLKVQCQAALALRNLASDGKSTPLTIYTRYDD